MHAASPSLTFLQSSSEVASMLTRLPNLLTMSRIVVIPVMVAAFYLRGDISNWITFGLFAFASITDYLDGWLARRLDVVSDIGRFLDPVADKLLVAAAIVMLVALDRAPAIPALIIICREILVSGLREHLATIEVGLPVSRLAKWKTAAQMAALCLLLIGNALPVFPAALIGEILLWVAAVLTLITGFDYVRHGLRHIGGGTA